MENRDYTVVSANEISNLEIGAGAEVSKQTPKNRAAAIFIIGFLIAVASLFALFITRNSIFASDQTTANFVFNKIYKFAFGSCTSYDLRAMDIWNDAIIPNEPDAWLWTGDMVYLDDPDVNCKYFQDTLEWYTTCNCTATWLSSCNAGNIDYANKRWLQMLSNEQYNNFLDYMCPAARIAGNFPPRGSDPQICEKPILGIYDDHDFGMDNSNERLPHKSLYKNMFLDAIGESQDSPRRGADRGAYFKYTLNEPSDPAQLSQFSGQLVDVFVLDGRYERETLPCDARRDYCLHLVLPDSAGQFSAAKKAWCVDYLGSSDGHGPSIGTCCSKDEDIYYGWCLLPTSSNSIYYREACDVTYDLFGHRALVFDPITRDLRPPLSTDWTDQSQSSPFCEVLGRNQRKWLREVVQQSQASVKIFVSGSVVLANPASYVCGTSQPVTPINSSANMASYVKRAAKSRSTEKSSHQTSSSSHNPKASDQHKSTKPAKTKANNHKDNKVQIDSNNIISNEATATSATGEPVSCRCSGDNWDCYSVAQRELLHVISQASGCSVILTGDFHFSDIKALLPGKNQLYSQVYGSEFNSKPIYQVMASGMSTSTGLNFTCADFRLDPFQMRTHPECSFVRGPSYGTIEFEYGSDKSGGQASHGGQKFDETVIDKLRLQILGGYSANDVKLETVIDAKTCLIIP